MLKGIKLRLYPTKKQEQQLIIMFGNDRFLWNILLAGINQRYKNNPSFRVPTNRQMDYLLVPLKAEYPFLKDSDSKSLQVVTQNLYQAWKKFFNDKTHKFGKPRFRTLKATKQSYTGKASVKVVAKRYVRLPKLGYVKTSSTEPLKNCKIKRYTVQKEPTGKYYLSLQVEFENQKLKPTGKAIGIDLGVHDLAITSDGIKYDKLQFKQLEKKARKWQSKYNRRLHGVTNIVESHNHDKHRLYDLDVQYFSNWQKARKNKTVYQAKIANQRKDTLHKVTTELVKNYDVIVLENLKSKNMMKNHNLANAISSNAWYMFKTILAYKCNWYGKQLIMVDPKNTSRICSNCGKKNHGFDNLTQNQWLNIRNWTCPYCHKNHDRDINAAKNILNRGLNQTNIQLVRD